MNLSLLSTAYRALLCAALIIASTEVPSLVGAAPSPETLLSASATSTGGFSHSVITGKIQRAQTGRDIKHCVSNDMVALTFDDGPGLNTREIVDELNRHGVKATFFVDGLEADQPWSDTDKENLKYTYQHGHQIASHTYTHADLPKLNEGQITKEMNDISNAINEVIGVRPTFMRPPYGNLSQAVLNTLKKLGYYVVTWNADTNDWRHPHDTNASIQEFKKEFNKSPGSSFISLEHDTQPGTNAQFVREIVQFLKSKGKRIVRMDECINADAYRK